MTKPKMRTEEEIEDISNDVSEKPYEIIETENSVIIEVFHMPKTKAEWKEFNKIMRFFGSSNPDIERQLGEKAEKDRTRRKKNPNSLLFALKYTKAKE